MFLEFYNKHEPVIKLVNYDSLHTNQVYKVDIHVPQLQETDLHVLAVKMSYEAYVCLEMVVPPKRRGIFAKHLLPFLGSLGWHHTACCTFHGQRSMFCTSLALRHCLHHWECCQYLQQPAGLHSLWRFSTLWQHALIQTHWELICPLVCRLCHCCIQKNTFSA